MPKTPDIFLVFIDKWYSKEEITKQKTRAKELNNRLLQVGILHPRLIFLLLSYKQIESFNKQEVKK